MACFNLEKNRAEVRHGRVALFDFLFQIPEEVVVKEVEQRDIQSVADLLDRRDGGAVVPAADDVVQGRLRDPGNRG